MPDLLPGTEVAARGLRWELVCTQNLGSQTLYRLRGLQGDFAGREIDLLGPFDEITPIARDLRPEKPARFHTEPNLPYLSKLSLFLL